MYSVHCAVSSVQYTLSTVVCAVVCVQCAMCHEVYWQYSHCIHYVTYSVLLDVFICSMPSLMYTIQSVFYSVQCSVQRAVQLVLIE